MKTPPLHSMLFTLACLFVGCASVPMASTSSDKEAKTFRPESGKGSVYLTRSGSPVGGAVAIEVTVDGRLAGALAPGTYALLSLAPGPHVIALSGTANMVQEKVIVEAGTNYFFETSVSMGWAPGGNKNIRPISSEQGQKQILNLKRAEMTTYE